MDIQRWIASVVPIHVELIRHIVYKASGQATLEPNLLAYMEMARAVDRDAKDLSPADRVNFQDFVLAVDDVRAPRRRLTRHVG